MHDAYIPTGMKMSLSGNLHQTDQTKKTHSISISIPPTPPPLPNYRKLLCESIEANPSTPNCNSLEASHEGELESLVKRLFDWGCICGNAVIAVSLPIKHILQIGPRCGLVALSMAASVCENKGVPVDDLMTQAAQMGISLQGEIFSVDYMQQLANVSLPQCETQIITSPELADTSFLARQFGEGNIFLVPYDSDHNFSPACLQGHKAHWAILCGILITVEQLPENSANPQLLSLRPSENATALLMSAMPKQVYVLARQGKSRHLSAWSLAQLVASNNNLVQMDPDKEQSDTTYQLPPGGVKYGLCSRSLLLKLSKRKTNNN